MNLFQCWSVRNLLDLYVDRRLTPAAAARIDAHAKACANCREEIEAAAPPDLGGLGAPEVPAGLAAAILKEYERGAWRGGSPAVPGFTGAEGRPAWSEVVNWRELLRLRPAQAASLAYCLALAGLNARPGVPTQASSFSEHASAHTVAVEPASREALP